MNADAANPHADLLVDALIAFIQAELRPGSYALRGEGGLARMDSGVGGGLRAAVDELGLDPLIALLPEGATLELIDGEVGLTLRREAAEVEIHTRLPEGELHQRRALQPPALQGEALVAALHDRRRPLWIGGGVARVQPAPGDVALPVVEIADLGAASFRAAHGVRAAYIAGEMAGGIASPEMVIAMGSAGLMGFYGAGGLDLAEVERSIGRIAAALGDAQAWGVNLLHNPAEPRVEEATVDLLLRLGCRRVSASAFMSLTPALVRYRLSGVYRDAGGRIVAPNRVFAKVSRAEVGELFLRPPPAKLVAELIAAGALPAEVAPLAALLPMAEDITVEADSGGHTDHRPLVALIPMFTRLRARVMAEEGYAARGVSIHIGAAGGLGDPTSVHAAFALGADYVLTGSINQACVEAGTSGLAKMMLAAAGVADCTTGPAPDMFEMGARVQVLGQGSLWAQRAQRLYELYRRYRTLDEIPPEERKRVESNTLRRTFAEVWADTRAFWAARDPRELARAEADPHHQMALVFRWYLGLSSRWARVGDPDRRRDYQIWCGPAMGLFNDWARGSLLEPLEARRVVDVAEALLAGAAALRRVEVARALGLALPPTAFSPSPALR